MANVFKALGNMGNSIKSGVKAASETKGGKAVITGAGIGGGVALTGAGIGGGVNLLAGGVSDGIQKVADANPLNGVVKAIVPSVTNEAAKGIGSVLGIAILIGIGLLVVFVFIPKINKNKRGRK